jgi:hypothetical protein
MCGSGASPRGAGKPGKPALPSVMAHVIAFILLRVQLSALLEILIAFGIEPAPQSYL